MKWDSLFKILSDATRLRILNLLDEAELNGNELMELLSIPQSSVSKHLKELRNSRLIDERKEGTWRFYTLRGAGLPSQALKMLKEIWSEKEYQRERAQVAGLLEKRRLFSEAYFLQEASAREGLGVLYSEETLLRALSFLLPRGAVILDGGFGNGRLLRLLSVNKELRLYGLDRYYQNEGRKEGTSQEIRVSQGDLRKTDFPADFFHVIFTNMVLHHIDKPEEVFSEIKRILKHGGRWIIIDFAKHEEESMRVQFKDYWLGFSGEEIKGYAEQAGLEMIAYEEGQEGNGKKRPFPGNCLIIIEKT